MNTLSTNSDRWRSFRNQMPVTENWAYFDHAAVAPLSGAAREAIVRWAEQAAQQGDAVWPAWAKRIEEIRATAAKLFHAQADEIAFVRNTTEGISFVAEGFPWQQGDNVITLDNEFPSNQYPWMNLACRGVEVRRLACADGRVDLQQIADACDQKTRIVAISWVGYASGWRVDLDPLVEMVHSNGALLFLDAIQGLGVFPLDLSATKVDFLAADGHKWMLGPEGAGLFYIHKEHLDLLRPVEVGWNSVVQAHDFAKIELNFKPSARRFEGGSQNMPGIMALGASLDLLASLETAKIGQQIVQYTDIACERLQQIGAELYTIRDPNHCSGIVTFQLPGRNSQELRDQCFQEKIVLSCRTARLRISPHAYNNEQDLDRLIDCLSDCR